MVARDGEGMTAKVLSRQGRGVGQDCLDAHRGPPTGPGSDAPLGPCARSKREKGGVFGGYWGLFFYFLDLERCARGMWLLIVSEERSNGTKTFIDPRMA